MPDLGKDGSFFKMSGIECLLRNDGNSVYPGHRYELNYHDDGVATDLAPLRFTDRVAMKSSALPAVELIPEWDKAIESGHSGVRLIEMPLQANIFSLYVESVIKSGKLLYQKRAFMRRRLIVACRCCGETDVFVKHYPRPFVSYYQAL